MEQHTLDAIMRLEEMHDLQAARAYIADYSKNLGFSSVACLKIAGPGEEYANNLYISNRPEQWISRYMEENQPLRDPVLQELRRTALPFSWSDVAEKPPMPGADIAVMHAARDFNMTDGFVVPVFLQNGYAAVVSYTTDYANILPSTRKAASLFGLYAHSKLRALIAPEPETPPLSMREREVMLWVAAGKTDDEIGNIIALSRKTVHQYVERAKTKLKATTRTYAVIQALRSGELNI